MTAHASLFTQGLRLAACVLVACSTKAPKKTAEPPDLGPLLALYEAPTANFEDGDLDAIALLLDAITGQLAGLAIEAELDALLDAIATAELESGADTTLEAGGFVRVTRICPGWETPPVPDRARNGFQVVTARFTGSGVEPLVWGDVERCRYRVGDSRIEIDATDGSDFSLAVVRAASADDSADTSTLFVVRLEVTINAELAEFSADFRVLPEGAEYRLEQENGSLIARTDPDGTLHVRAANGRFICDGALACREEIPAP